MVDFAGSHVVVTGGTGALGRAVIGALRGGNAICHVPNLVAAELDGFPYATDPGVHIALDVDLADEAAVKRFYQALPPLWASIHLAGGFAMAPIGDTSAADFIAQFRMNALSCFLCSAAAVAAFRARKGPGPHGAEGGRIVNVSARPALEPRHPREPDGDAGRGSPPLGLARRHRGNHHLSRLSGQSRHPRRGHPGLRRVLGRTFGPREPLAQARL